MDEVMAYLKARADYVVRKKEVLAQVEAADEFTRKLKVMMLGPEMVHTGPVPNLTAVVSAVEGLVKLRNALESRWKALPSKSGIKAPWEN